MRSALLISAAGAVIAALILAALLIFTDLLSFGEPRRSVQATGSADRALLICDGIELLAPGDSRQGIAIRETATGIGFELESGGTVAVDEAEGMRLVGDYVILNDVSAGYFLAPEAGGEEIYVTFVRFARSFEPRTSQEAIRLYRQTADSITGAGELPFCDTALRVVSVEPVQDAVFACLETDQGRELTSATRFVGPLMVSTFLVAPCGPETAEITARIDAAEASLAANR